MCIRDSVRRMKMNKAIITVVGKDRVGIIAGVCTYLAENQINICLLYTSIIPPLEVHKALYEPSWEAERFGIYFSRDTVTSFLSLCGREAFGHIFSQPKRTIPSEFRPKIEEPVSYTHLLRPSDRRAQGNGNHSHAVSLGQRPGGCL